MKILVISDTHLEQFDYKKFVFLKKIISGADQVILNGDFWEGQSISLDSFLNSPWKQLFPLLKQKKAIYIYGNHDKEELNHKRTDIFSDIQTNRYSYLNGNITYIFEHGHRLCPFPAYRKNSLKYFPFLVKLEDDLEKIIIKTFGKSFFKLYCTRFNNKIKRLIKNELLNNQFFICGHTHLPEIDIKNKFANCGFIKYGYASYLMITNGKIKLYEERYD